MRTRALFQGGIRADGKAPMSFTNRRQAWLPREPAAPRRSPRPRICRSLPASESCQSTVITAGKDSPAGQLLQGDPQPEKAHGPESEFVGACLQANRAVEQSSLQATIRRQASSYKGKGIPKALAPDSEFVGACLQANRAVEQASPQATNRRQASSYKGTGVPKALAPDSEFVGACLQANRAVERSSPQAKIRR